MHNMKKLILSVFIFTFGFATATHAQQVNTLLTKKRFGLWGPYGAKNVSWGNFAHFVEYAGAVTSSSPVHRQCRLRGQLPSRRHSLGYCLSQASKYEWPPSSPVVGATPAGKSPSRNIDAIGHARQTRGPWHEVRTKT
jgi:hypothetical protein